MKDGRRVSTVIAAIFICWANISGAVGDDGVAGTGSNSDAPGSQNDARAKPASQSASGDTPNRTLVVKFTNEKYDSKKWTYTGSGACKVDDDNHVAYLTMNADGTPHCTLQSIRQGYSLIVEALVPLALVDEYSMSIQQGKPPGPTSLCDSLKRPDRRRRCVREPQVCVVWSGPNAKAERKPVVQRKYCRNRDVVILRGNDLWRTKQEDLVVEHGESRQLFRRRQNLSVGVSRWAVRGLF